MHLPHLQIRKLTFRAFAQLLLLPGLALISQPARAQQYSPAIEDNSFFIEEAINQETGVIQHISNGYSRSARKDALYTFTEEWPVGGQDHQVSVTLPWAVTDAASQGLGDIAVNYRYQLMDGNDWCWVAPRLSVVLPTGDDAAGLGAGAMSVQTNLCVSKRWSENVYMHANLGVAMLPQTSLPGGGIRKTLPAYTAGASGIWLLSESFNIMCEALFTHASALDAEGGASFSNEVILSPGLRYAAMLGTVQIVPGVAVPLVFTRDAVDSGVYFYLSFEHPL
ncbi:MAG: transporter [Ignavibacteria bacterium]|nr:transporter [Ignavibacteria bacterium]